jgi:hypothetical protein
MTKAEINAVRRELSGSIQGTVIGADDSGYGETVNIDNGRISRQPLLVAIPSTAKDVATIVRFCRDHEIRLTSKSGGHGAAGYCLNSTGMVLDLRKLSSIRVTRNGRGLQVATGARWIQLYDYLQEHNSKYMVIGGGCGTVGIGGYILGGGYSFISRSYGLACDNMRGLEFVSADGQVHQFDHRSTHKHEIDLFWALRGGGGGNFGVVTKVDLELHRPASERIMMGQTAFPFERLSELLEFYNSWALSLPREMAVYGMIRRFPDPRNRGKSTLFLHLNPVYNGPFPKGMALLKPLIEMQPASIELYAMTLSEWENFIGNGTALSGKSAYIRSAMLGRGRLTDDVADICTKYLAASPSLESFVVWTHAGGQIRAGGSKTSCFAHRDAEFAFELKAIWPTSHPEQARANVEWAVDFFDEIETHSQGAYLNYMDPLLVDWQAKYYGQSYNRLLEIKNHWDSKGMFDFQQGIGSRFLPSRKRPLDISPLLNT